MFNNQNIDYLKVYIKNFSFLFRDNSNKIHVFMNNLFDMISIQIVIVTFELARMYDQFLQLRTGFFFYSPSYIVN